MLVEQEGEKRGKQDCGSRLRGWSLTFLFSGCWHVHHACGGLMFAGRL